MALGENSASRILGVKGGCEYIFAQGTADKDQAAVVGVNLREGGRLGYHYQRDDPTKPGFHITSIS